MATYAIGDIHGCWLTLQQLLNRIDWKPDRDRLWLVGDLVNRGPSSLEVLRWAVDHSDRVTAVLGNHDLHLLARAEGLRARPDDTLDAILQAHDRDVLLSWLRHRPLLHFENDNLLVHAGLWPTWEIEEARSLADQVSTQLVAEGGIEALYEARKTTWQDGLNGIERLAAALGVFTLIRVVSETKGVMLGFTDAPETSPQDYRPWFETSRLVSKGTRVVFGHWAMLGHHRYGSTVCLDSGCHWGGSLTALRLDDDRVFAQPVVQAERWSGWVNDSNKT